ERRISMSVQENLQVIETKIEKALQKVNRSRDELLLIGVTKYVSNERAQEAIDAGVMDLGENRAEELMHKYEALQTQANWHFIGTLQSRKVKDVVNKVTTIHSLDRLSIVKQINKRSEKIIECFVQVNVSQESTKHGLNLEEVLPFIESLADYDKVRIVGLMTMAQDIQEEHEIRQELRSFRGLQNEIAAKQLSNGHCHYLSIGMSNDFDIAIEEGATHLRLGSQLVGS